MDTFSASLALCAGNSPVTGEFPSQRSATRGFDVSLICARTNCRANNRDAGDLRRHRAHYDVTLMTPWEFHLFNLTDHCVTQIDLTLLMLKPLSLWKWLLIPVTYIQAWFFSWHWVFVRHYVRTTKRILQNKIATIEFYQNWQRDENASASWARLFLKLNCSYNSLMDE